MDVCNHCNKNAVNVITKIDGEEAGLCWSCYNQIISEELGVELTNEMKEVALRDHAGVLRRFSITQRLDPLGIFMEAVEMNECGYAFAVHGELDDDQQSLLQKLLDKVKAGLAESYVEKDAFPNGQTYHSITNDHFLGRIDHGGEHDGPVVVIDGKPYTWEEVGEMMKSYEGFQLQVKIFDMTDDVDLGI
ncbi:DUF7713 domain-containing protein [Halobacillus amylolyticus]|uniref:Uncharacterized protein n=1 Tax=Halobacillus amylolyticus TaxID=2932259 RepID=A0ABY4H8Y4_9BACI|nr:hypothetical protein [Halobacillus amylolyticus]UOR11333.1 hypothetical protein MUO15_17305 [Halobacillus amylolyticus]